MTLSWMLYQIIIEIKPRIENAGVPVSLSTIKRK